MGEVRIKWTDPEDILTNEPVPCTWAGTHVVRKEDSPPKHRYDGVLIADSTIRNQYEENALVDDTIEVGKTYYYGIFPYDTRGWHRYTKSVHITISQAPPETVIGLVDSITITKSGGDTLEFDNEVIVIKV